MMVKVKKLTEILENDLIASDFKWTLFVAAANSYKYDSLLKPFPSMFFNNNNNNQTLDIFKLREAIAKVPAFSVFLNDLHRIAEQNSFLNMKIDEETIDLIYWCLLSNREPSLKSINRLNFNSVLDKVISVVPEPKPTHIFEVLSSPNSVAEEKFRSYLNDSPTFFAYHGSKLECFHSILNYGLQQHLCKTALYGEGIYLSSELHVSLFFSPTGHGWNQSRCGTQVAMLAICEFVNHPTHLHYDTKEKANQSGVPDKYFVITNNEIIRIRYLVVYGSENRTGSQAPVHGNRIIRWVNHHKWIAAMIAYAVVLFIIGISNSRQGYFFRQFIRQQLNNFIEMFYN